MPIESTLMKQLLQILHRPLSAYFSHAKLKKPSNTMDALRLLSSEDDVTAGRLSEYLDIKPASITQMLNKLETSGKIARIKSEKDARITYVVLTDLGKHSTTTEEGLSVRVCQEIFKGFTKVDLAQLNVYLARIDSNIKDEEIKASLDSILAEDRDWQRFTRMLKNRHQKLDGSRIKGFKH